MDITDTQRAETIELDERRDFIEIVVADLRKSLEAFVVTDSRRLAEAGAITVTIEDIVLRVDANGVHRIGERPAHAHGDVATVH